MSKQQREAATLLALCVAQRHALEDLEKEAKAIVDCTYGEEKVCGVVDGVVVGTTGRYERRPNEPFTVLDEAGFVDWVKARYPTEVVEVVRPAFLKVLAERSEKHGVLVDDDGEVCDAVKLNDPIVSVRTYVKRTDEAQAIFTVLQQFPLAVVADRIRELAAEVD
ncbi:hypothetical protein [Mycobacterium sp. SMC-4]|uniref:hypothetical protein n=1 Tax=Mycobacterium sp. SMC-4 TaxID=2857059 RepID=UPI0021B3DB1F|nr:hypothetical protein [Mycobacterium sp. SMC-4]UXA19500.1 hypothetical protein KXD98_07840 [Mycobacterium sp. SMC-4]